MIIAIDSNVFIAALSQKEEHSPNAQRLIRNIAGGKHQAIASSIVYGEIYSVSLTPTELDLEGFFSQIDNLNTVASDDKICIRAGKLRLKLGSKLRLPDAMHLATALNSNADLFITNDKKLAKAAQKLIPTKLLSQLASL
jgi:predicted nucleic acid-binding protein